MKCVRLESTTKVYIQAVNASEEHRAVTYGLRSDFITATEGSASCHRRAAHWGRLRNLEGARREVSFDLATWLSRS